MGEGLLDGLRREMIEETGVKPEIGKLLFIQQFAESGEQSAHGPNEQLEFFFLITNLARLPAHQPRSKLLTVSRKWRNAALLIQKPRGFYQAI